MSHLEPPEGRPRTGEPTTPATVGSDPDLMMRPRLLDLLPSEPVVRSTVLRAPAGYGKTVLASRWAESRSTLPAHWVSLRRSDDAERIAARLLAGVHETDPDVTASTADHRATTGQVMAEVRHELEHGGDVVLVVDGVDAPEQPGLVDELERWMSSLPDHVRLLTTRRSPPGPAAMRAGGSMAELAAPDLAFTPDELRAVVHLIGGVALDDDQLAELIQRTGGWPFAVQIAAAAMRSNADVDAALGRLHGGNRQLAALFSFEVLDPAPDPVRQFLLRTSVLDRLDGRLCAALTATPDAAALLASLERRGAFIEGVVDESGSYRYHPLFRDHLRTELRVEDPAAEHLLLERTIETLSQDGRPDEAARYAIDAGEPDRVIELVDLHARASFEQGDPASMLELLDALPTRDLPEVALRRAFLLTMLGETQPAEQALRDAEDLLVDPGLLTASQALRSTWVFFDGAPSSSIKAANKALDLLHTTDPASIPDLLGLTAPHQLEAMTLGSRARALWCSGELETAREELLGLLRHTDLYPPWHVHVVSTLALVEAWSGHLRRALALGRRAAVLADAHGLLQHPATLDAYLAVAHALRDRNDLVRSDRLLLSVEDRLQRFRRPTTLATCIAERASWCLATGQTERGVSLLHDLRISGEPPPPSIVEHRLRAAAVRLWIDRGDLDRADAAIGTEPELDASLAAAAVHAAMARGDVDLAAERMSMWTNHPTDLRGQVERDLWTAVLAIERGERTAATARLTSEVIPAAAFEGDQRVVLDAGSFGERALRTLPPSDSPRYVHELLRAFDAGRAVSGGASVGLSQRELEILRYLPTDLSSAEIADQLYISLNTLKTHLRTIYRKLEVGGRRQAIERATELGIA